MLGLWREDTRNLRPQIPAILALILRERLSLSDSHLVYREIWGRLVSGKFYNIISFLQVLRVLRIRHVQYHIVIVLGQSSFTYFPWSYPTLPLTFPLFISTYMLICCCRYLEDVGLPVPFQ